MSTTDNTHTTTPSAEELVLWTSQTLDWFETNNRKLISKEIKADLAERGVRWCPTCRTVKVVTEYNKDASRPDGLRGTCRDCSNGVTAAWREDNPEYARTYYAEHREARLAHMHNRYHSDELYRLRIQLSKGYRRAVKAGNPAEQITAEDLLTFWSEKGIHPLTCALTGEQLTLQTRSVDHATPIGRGGSHQPSNLIPVSFDANHAKGTRTVLEFLADRAAEQNDEDLPDLVRKAMETSTPARAKRTVLLQIEEGADNE